MVAGVVVFDFGSEEVDEPPARLLARVSDQLRKDQALRQRDHIRMLP